MLKWIVQASTVHQYEGPVKMSFDTVEPPIKDTLIKDTLIKDTIEITSEQRTSFQCSMRLCYSSNIFLTSDKGQQRTKWPENNHGSQTCPGSHCSL